MKAWREALLLCALGLALPSQDASPAATARTSLEAAAVKGDPRALAQALGRRGGDWFDIVLSVVTEPIPALEPTRVLISVLPEPERAGIASVLDPLAGGLAAARQSFANALAALSALSRVFSESRGDPKALAEAVGLAEDRVKAAGNAWLAARGTIAKAMGKFEGDLAALEPELAAAAEKLTAQGDRYDAALALAFYSKALADKGDLEQAIAARERAQAAFKTLGALDKGGPVIRGALARIDLALAAPFFDDARDDAARDACARARAAFKTSDPMRDLEASAIEAAILVDRGDPALAVECTKAHVNRIPQIKDKHVLTRFSGAVAAALLLTAKGPAGLELLRKAVGRAKELGMTPNEESPLRAAMALAYIQSGQHEAAHAALEVVAKFAEDVALRPLAKAAVLNRAVLLYSQGRTEEVQKSFDRAAAITLGGPTIERVAAAGPFLAIAEQLVDKGKPKDALKFIRDAAAAADELGIRLDEVRTATTTVMPTGGDPIHVKLGIALGSYETGPDWAGFEPVFLVTERRLQDVLAKGAPDEPGPPDMMERLRESDRQIRKLRRSAAGARAPIAEDEAKRIVAFRRVTIEEAWSRAPTFALRRFPRAGSIKHARDNYCGVDGAIFGASVTPESAYAFAFSRDRFSFSAVNASLGLHEAVSAFAALVKDPRSTPAAWIGASAPIWEHLIQKHVAVFEDKKWLVVCPDPVIDTIPIEALVPGDAKTDNWKTLPYLIQKIAVGRMPTSSLALEQRNRRVAGWLAEPFVAVAIPERDAPAAGLPFAQAFDPELKAETMKTARAGVFKLAAAEGDGTDSAPARRSRILVFGHGVLDHAVGWRGAVPAVVCLLDPPSAKEGANLAFRWMLRGVRAVIAPVGSLERPLADALMIGVLKSFAQDGSNPIEALAAAKRAILTGASKTAGAGLTDAHFHPAQWTQMQAWLVNP